MYTIAPLALTLICLAAAGVLGLLMYHLLVSTYGDRLSQSRLLYTVFVGQTLVVAFGVGGWLKTGPALVRSLDCASGNCGTPRWDVYLLRSYGITPLAIIAVVFVLVLIETWATRLWRRHPSSRI